MGTITVYDSWKRVTEDGDAETLSTFTIEYTEKDLTPDEFDAEDGYPTPVALAVRTLRTLHYMSGPDCASAQSPSATEASGYTWPGPGTWFMAKTYEHPYEDKYQEVTAHLHGWSDDDAQEIWRQVTAR